MWRGLVRECGGSRGIAATLILTGLAIFGLTALVIVDGNALKVVSSASQKASSPGEAGWTSRTR